MNKKPTKSKQKNRAEPLVDERYKAEVTSGRGMIDPNNRRFIKRDAEAPQSFGETDEQKQIRELHARLHNDVPDVVWKLFEQWEAVEFVPQDFETEVATDSLESSVGYSSLYRHLHRAFVKQVAYYRSGEGGSLDIEDARAAAFHSCIEEGEAVKELNTLLSLPVDLIGFIDVLKLHNYSPRVAERFWERTKMEGRREFESGHLAAHIAFPVDYKKTLWNIAKYLGVRESFIDEWEPRGGIEISLIDSLAQTYFQFQYWIEQTVARSQTPVRTESNTSSKWRSEQQEQYRIQEGWNERHWFRPFVSESAAIEQAVQMSDRFHRMYIRTLRQMRDHRRYSPIMISNAKQINIAADGGEQINVLKVKNSSTSP